MSESQSLDTTDSKKFAEQGNVPVDVEKKENSEIDSGFSLQGLNPFYKGPQAKMPVSKYAVDYNMTHANRGIAVIFNNKIFDEKLRLKDRRGTDRDRDNFKNALLHLGFKKEDILVYNDVTVKKIRNELESIAEMDHTDNDCIVVGIFSHGDQGFLYGTDKKFKSEQLWEPFLGNKCLTLAGKPKLIFIQACQGDRFDDGVRTLDVADGRETNYKIPAYADILISYSTVPGFFSWRNTEEGSWFIQALASILIHFGHELDLLTMLTLVNQKVALEFESTTPQCTAMDQKKQVPCISSMLMRRVFFPQKPSIV